MKAPLRWLAAVFILMTMPRCPPKSAAWGHAGSIGGEASEPSSAPGCLAVCFFVVPPYIGRATHGASVAILAAIAEEVTAVLAFVQEDIPARPVYVCWLYFAVRAVRVLRHLNLM